MSFYLQPPKGKISLSKLNHFVHTRFSFLSKILEAEDDRMKLQDICLEMQMVQDSECLIEGTMKEKISHFMLRLVCCQSPEMLLFFINAETMLFDWRFSCMSEQELCKLLKTLDPYILTETSCKHRNDARFTRENVRDILKIFSNIKQDSGKWRRVVRKYLNGETSKCFCVPFENVLRLVRQREVNLRKGIANVPFCHLKSVVTHLFRRLLQIGMEKARINHNTDDDERIQELVNSVKATYRRSYRPRELLGHVYRSPVAQRDIDGLGVCFPPCMSHALRTLRNKHRLSHHTRIQLTLFLKELGLPIHEALVLWKDEYSKPSCNHGSGCNHDWVHDERRYTYNIRHLYGLEGSRTNYRGHSCKCLQEDFQGHKEEGGCFFRHFDRENLTKVMADEGFNGNCEGIINRAADGKYNLACHEYMQYKIKRLCHDRQYPMSNCETDHRCMKEKNLECSKPNSNSHLKTNEGEIVILKSRNTDIIKPSDERVMLTDTSIPCCVKNENLCSEKDTMVTGMNNLSSASSYNISHSTDLDFMHHKNNLDKTFNKNSHETGMEWNETKNACSVDSNLIGTNMPVRLSRPIDYYLSYRNLLDSLTNSLMHK